MKQTLLMLILAAVLTLPLSSAHAEEADGGYAGAFLQIPVGARPTAMGGAYTALSNDGAAPLFNPAGITSLTRPLFSSSYRAMKLDRSLGFFSAFLPTRGQSVIGINWLYAGSGSVAARDAVDGDLLGHDVEFNQHSIGVLFAKRFTPRLSLGANFAYLVSTFPEETAFTVGVDVGAMLHVDYFFHREDREDMAIRDIQIGATVKNLGSNYSWSSDGYFDVYGGGRGGDTEEKVPMEFGLGVSARFLQRKLVLATDLLKNVEQSAELHAGAEYFISPEFAVRGGYSDERLTVGTGYLIRLKALSLAIDYAFATDKVDEGDEHIFSFDLLIN